MFGCKQWNQLAQNCSGYSGCGRIGSDQMAAKRKQMIGNDPYIQEWIGTTAEKGDVPKTNLPPLSKYYETDTKKIYLFDGSDWVDFTGE